MKIFYGMFGVEMRAYGQKLVKFCTQTHRRVSFSSVDTRNFVSDFNSVEGDSDSNSDYGNSN